MTDEQTSKRELLKKAVYVAPTILTLKVAPAFAQSGSGRQGPSGEQGPTGQQGSGFAEKDKDKEKEKEKEKDKEKDKDKD